MMDRRRVYSIAEIAAMRQAVLEIVGFSGGFECFGNIQAANAVIEDQLRTYMQNGTLPDELTREAERLRATAFDYTSARSAP